jgi:hypothetical protein
MEDRTDTTERLVRVDITDFVAGYPGSGAVSMFDADFRVVAVLVYREGFAVDWVIRPDPNVSPIAAELDDSDHRFISRLSEALRPEATEERLFARRLWTLIDAATVTDDAGTRYRPGSRGWESVRGGTAGRFTFAPAPPAAAAHVSLQFGGRSIPTQLSQVK